MEGRSASRAAIGPVVVPAGGPQFPGNLEGDERLDHGQRKVAGVAQQVVGPFLLEALDLVAYRHDAAVGEGALFRNRVGRIIPACGLECRGDVLATGIGFSAHRPCEQCYRAGASVVQTPGFVTRASRKLRGFCKYTPFPVLCKSFSQTPVQRIGCLNLLRSWRG
jgi:hypothetical protein